MDVDRESFVNPYTKKKKSLLLQLVLGVTLFYQD